jgi:phage terminase large subunit GpA-like protein
MTAVQWAESRRYLSDLSAIPGRYSFSITPWWRGVLEWLDDPAVDEIHVQKSAQIGYTEGITCNALGWTIDADPAPVMVMFPRDKSAKDFNAEKFIPMCESTPTLRDKVNLKSRDKDNRQDFKRFPGGFVKFVGSNSPGNVKSTAAKRIIIEEPDDAAADVRNQGDAIALIDHRKKTFAGLKVLMGGTPTVKGVSTIEAAVLTGDQHRWFVPCHHCGEKAPLDWQHVRWSQDDARSHPIYGNALPDTARYVCPACGGEWTDAQRAANARHGEWRPTAQGAARKRSALINELVSGFPGSTLPHLVARYLEAQKKAEAGDAGDLIAFVNSSLGEAWHYDSEVPESDELEKRCEPYSEWTVPAGGLLVTAGVDVQHDRLAVVVRAWGRGEESWIVWWGELYGNVLEQPVWDELCGVVLDRHYEHATGARLPLYAMSIDSGDGNTADAVYRFARTHRRRRVYATKGSSTERADIFRKPAEMLDVTAQHKAAKYGLRPYMVGVSRAKDLLLGSEGGGRIQLAGSGPGRMHWYKGVRPDYFDQLTAEVKAPRRTSKGKVWQKKVGKRNEALDCEILALHAAKAQRIDTWTEAKWQELEQQLVQPPLFERAADPDEQPETNAPAAPARVVIRPPNAGVRPRH